MQNRVYKTVNYDGKRETFAIEAYYTKNTKVFLDGQAFPLGYKSVKETEIMLKLSERFTDDFNGNNFNRGYN